MRQLCYTNRTVCSSAYAPCCFSRRSSEQGPLPIYTLNLTERFRNWRFYVEAGLAKSEVQVHIYTSMLKVEYQETDLAMYTVEWQDDNKHIKEVTNPRVIETRYRSPQLTLWSLDPDEWLLFKKLPDYAARKRRRQVGVIQLPLPPLDTPAQAMEREAKDHGEHGQERPAVLTMVAATCLCPPSFALQCGSASRKGGHRCA
jgi:hypothetical protein